MLTLVTVSLLCGCWWLMTQDWLLTMNDWCCRKKQRHANISATLAIAAASDDLVSYFSHAKRQPVGASLGLSYTSQDECVSACDSMGCAQG